MSRRNPLDESLISLLDSGMITQVRFMVKSGKEATVYCCDAAPYLGGGLAAAKLYRPREQRGFKNDAVYRQGRYITDSHLRRSVASKGRKGREFLFNSWITHEASAISRLYEVGVRVPRLIATSENALLMEFVGDENGAAPRLCEVAFEPGDAAYHLRDLLRMIETMLRAGFIHGDLSPFNVLYWNGQATIIDLPQTADPWTNPDALDLLIRDVTNICDYFSEQGIPDPPRDPERIARGMWHRLRFGNERNR